MAFTDLVDSTALKSQLPGDDVSTRNRAYLDAVLFPHRQRVETLLAEYQGRVVKTEGDAYFATFLNASQAALWAVAVQETHLRDPIPTPLGPLKVKIGLHTGSPLAVEDDFLGQEVDYAARVSALANGGQITLSETTASLIRDAGIQGIRLHPHGERDLKGIGKVPIYELLYADRTPQPLKAPSASLTNLPTLPTSYIGRESSLSAWRDLLHGPARLLTLLGMGGIGKTRSALQIAGYFAGEEPETFPDGVWWVELEEARNGEEMIHRIAAALNFPTQSHLPIKDQLCGFLRDRTLLLVLDNLEQIPDAAKVLHELLRAGTSIKVVATSRSALEIQAERQIEVPPLPLDDSIRLFVERAQSRRADFELSDANRDDIAELCRRLEGMPLAIELAASRIAGMTPRDILSRFTDRFKLLQTRAPDLPDRQRALRGAIDWSYELLTEDDRALFCDLGIFAGGFTLEDVEAVCDAFDPFESVGELRRQSLIKLEVHEATQQSRYFMLVSLQEYTAEKRKERPDGGAELQRRHADYFLQWARQHLSHLRTPGEAEALKGFERGADNVRSAMTCTEEMGEYLLSARLALALGIFYQRRGFQREAVQCLQRGLSEVDRLPEGRKSTAAELLKEKAGLQLDLSEWEQAGATAREALSIFTGLSGGDKKGMAEAENLLGLAAKGRKNYNEARIHYSQALSLFGQIGDQVASALVLTNLGLVEYLDPQGNNATAVQYLTGALQLHRAGNDQRGAAAALNNLGTIYFDGGQLAEARRCHQETLEMEARLQNARGVGRALCNLGEVVEREGEVQQTLRCYLAADNLFRTLEEIGSPYRKYAEETLARFLGGLQPEPALLNSLRQQMQSLTLEGLAAWILAEPKELRFSTDRELVTET